MKQKLLLLIAIAFVNITSLSAQISGNSWYLNHATNDIITPTNIIFGSYSASETNPNTTGINTSTTVSSFVKADGNHSQIKFDLSAAPITDLTTTTFKIQAYLDVAQATVDAATACNIRIQLKDVGSNTSTTIVTKTISVGQEWVEYTFDFSGITQSASSYDQMIIYFASADTDDDAIGFEYFIDALQGPNLGTLSSNEILTNNSKLQITPNPVSHNFQLSDSKDVKNIQVYNINGSLLKTFTVSDNYSVSDLADGIYIAKINTAFGSKVVKIVKK
ncbi:T9SS type A sorting domain-containing protein [Neotamlana sedimentorum]|uniref:T9SS type A sorting domain-containing protein n=1 Tax=Neotamlana sedimentorum TaxID=1435349 RepID=UPI00069B9061|nr:T9SS type A sorting domain-containing protein [Tamlana sedimentorum]